MECPFKKQKLDNGVQNGFNNGEIPLDKNKLLEDRLREFQVLDEVQGSNSESENESVEYTSESDYEMDNDELENLLDEPLPEELKNKKKDSQYEEKFKTVLIDKARNHFEVMAEGWVQVSHNSGMPLYLHKSTRVCTMSRPYFLGPGSVRKHEIPVSAIPCLSYRKALEKDKEIINESLENGTPENSNTESTDQTNEDKQLSFPNTKIETVSENIQAQSLTADQINEYCTNLFHFKKIRVMRFKSWSARRKFTKNKKNIKNLQRPTLPDGTKLITFPVLKTDGDNLSSNRTKKEWILNPNGKSYVCILHEYVQHALKKQPSYDFKELENAATPYSATVTINGVKYGTGFGTSKKQAKSESARETLEILIPEMRDKITADKSGTNSTKDPYKDFSVFDNIMIEDPRVAEFCVKTTEPTPHAILLTCLQRNFGLGDLNIQYEVNTLKHKKNEYTMTVGKHTATVICKNKRDGKQHASQAILQALHPHIKSWGSLLRLYGNRSVKSFKEKKQEEQEITVLQSMAAFNQPNYAILDKLALEMGKLKERRDAVQSIGTFIPPNDINLPIATGSNLSNVDF